MNRLFVLLTPSQIYYLRLILLVAFLFFMFGLIYGAISINSSVTLDIPNLRVESITQRSSSTDSAIEVINKYQHWGKYANKPNEGFIHEQSLYRAFQLVGIEYNERGSAALLFFLENSGVNADSLVAKPDANGIIHITQGDRLIDDIIITEIGADAVYFVRDVSSADGETEINQTGNWQLSLYSSGIISGQ